ncbi:MAG: hypothetical protein Ct9H300mP11_19400 [Chloroflexota bacterium]|nr:MAG: hypothetical protein Ct9H300mP11_19400 [Chloroflexota bacterium]
MRHELGLDDHLTLRYAPWVSNAIQRGFRRILSHRRVNYWELFRRLPATLLLAATLYLSRWVSGIPLGVMAAVKQRSWLDSACPVLAIVGAAYQASLGSHIDAYIRSTIPMAASRWLRVVPKNFILPAIAFIRNNGPTHAAHTIELLEVLSQGYMRTARAKGLSENT